MNNNYGTHRAYLYFAFIVAFFSFFPFPALPIGNTTGLQLGHVFAVFFLIFFFGMVAKKKYSLFCFFVICIPGVFSLLADFNPINVNSFVSFSVAMALVLCVPASPDRGFLYFIRGVSLAIIIHGMLGLVQQYYYLSEDFPLIDIYINPSFSSVADSDIWKVYALYSKRSFGLFPEPSAMFASIAPWLALIGYKVISNEYREEETIGDRNLQKIAFYFGLALVILGRSGGTPSLFISLIPAIFIYFSRVYRKPTLKGIFLVFVLLVSFLVAAYFGFVAVNERYDDQISQVGSWDERSSSIIYGLASLFEGSFFDLIFGYGLGMVAPLTYAATGASSVHSWIVGYFMAHGIVGAIAFVSLLIVLILNINKSSNKVLGYSILFVWIVCASVVTGYIQLLPMWLSLGMLFNWHTIYLRDSK